MMLSSRKLSPETESVVTPPEMAHVLGQGRSSMQKQTLDAVREQIHDKHRARHSFGEPYLDPTCGLRQNGSTEEVAHLKFSEIDQKLWLGHEACNDGEIVKHMSNLPGFLQQVKKENSIQEKALNFGILDWKHLEKWKYNERMPGTYQKKTSSSISNSLESAPPKMGPNLKGQPSYDELSLSPLSSRKQPMAHGLRSSSPWRCPPPSHRSRLNSSEEKRNITYQKEEKYVEGIKSVGRETHTEEFQAAQSRAIHRQQDNFHQKVKFYDRSYKTNLNSRKREDLENKLISENEASLAEWGKHKISLSLNDKINAHGKTNEIRLDDRLEFTSHCPADQENIVHHGPNHIPKRSCSESSQFTESRTSLDGKLAEAIGNRLSGCFSPQELFSGDFSADNPHSCPLPSVAAVPTESALEPHNLVTSQAIDCQGKKPISPMPFEGKCSMVNEKTRKPSFSVEVSNKTQEEISKQPNLKGRPPSPTRRFSFNLGMMSRSFSFKESSAVPQLSSTCPTVKSGSVRPEISSVMDNFERDKANSSTRGRSSPLRRLLDPLLKHKGPQSAEIVRPPNGSLDSMTSRTMGIPGPTEDSKPGASSTFQAILQLTLKNELPFFKLVVDNSSDILTAVVKKLPASGKTDPCMISVFSVREIRKKNTNWISQGSNNKSSSLSYNIVGQMKISSSYHPKVNADGSNICVARECVLYGVNPGQTDKQKPELLPNEEIAAFVVKNSNEDLNGTVVILPGGRHGTPIKGAPSSLINRWRSGGSCDCGGWDIGCKLQILTDYKESSNVLEASTPSSATDRVDLFVQGGKSKPVFSLEPLSNGYYSIVLDASISLLEAFATCTAFITCGKFSSILDTKGQPDEERFPEVIVGTDKMKTAPRFEGEVPAKYVTSPPLSPAGRI